MILKDEWKYATTRLGVLCVMIYGVQMMQQSLADSLGSLDLVSQVIMITGSYGQA